METAETEDRMILLDRQSPCHCYCCRRWRMRLRDDLAYLVNEVCRVARVEPHYGHDVDDAGVAAHVCPKERLERGEWVRRRVAFLLENSKYSEEEAMARARTEHDEWMRGVLDVTVVSPEDRAAAQAAETLRYTVEEG